MNSFFPDGNNPWNNDIINFKNIPSIEILQKHILGLIRPEKKVSSVYTWTCRRILEVYVILQVFETDETSVES